jgi:hypothetical protein
LAREEEFEGHGGREVGGGPGGEPQELAADDRGAENMGERARGELAGGPRQELQAEDDEQRGFGGPGDGPRFLEPLQITGVNVRRSAGEMV